MIQCFLTRRRLDAARNRDASPPASERHHLESCSACAIRAARGRALEECLRAAAPRFPAAGRAEEVRRAAIVRAAVAAPAAPTGVAFPRLGYAAACAALLMAALGWYVFRPSLPSVEAPSAAQNPPPTVSPMPALAVRDNLMPPDLFALEGERIAEDVRRGALFLRVAMAL